MMRCKTLALAAGTAAIAAVASVTAIWAPDRAGTEPFPPAATVTILPALFEHRQPGEFLLASGRPAPAPRRRIEIRGPVEIMRYQVSVGEYERCVAAGECQPADSRGPADVPVTGVSHIDAEAYARWFSKITGAHWRLPTDAEWALAAAERFSADIEPEDDDPTNPARAWLSSYQREVDLGRRPDPQPRSRGSFGENSKGIADLAGNVWEWTSSCYLRTTFSVDGQSVKSQVENCGVHVVEGFHRTYMSNFIRDGKSGGCAVGLPPDNLGFRLIREKKGFFERLLY